MLCHNGVAGTGNVPSPSTVELPDRRRDPSSKRLLSSGSSLGNSLSLGNSPLQTGLMARSMVGAFCLQHTCCPTGRRNMIYFFVSLLMHPIVGRCPCSWLTPCVCSAEPVFCSTCRYLFGVCVWGAHTMVYPHSPLQSPHPSHSQPYCLRGAHQQQGTGVHFTYSSTVLGRLTSVSFRIFLLGCPSRSACMAALCTNLFPALLIIIF